MLNDAVSALLLTFESTIASSASERCDEVLTFLN